MSVTETEQEQETQQEGKEQPPKMERKKGPAPKRGQASNGGAKEPKEPDVMAELEKLDPYGDEKIWIIGKPPQEGGEEHKHWERYVQRPLGFMAKARFFALISGAIRRSLEAGSSVDELLAEAGVLRGKKLSADDFRDIGSVMPVVLRLVEETPDLLLACYCQLLDIPKDDWTWAKRIMERPYRPQDNEWGLSDDAGIEIIEIAIDQNWDEIRDFFSKRLGRIAARARQHMPEEEKDESKDPESDSDQ